MLVQFALDMQEKQKAWELWKQINPLHDVGNEQKSFDKFEMWWYNKKD